MRIILANSADTEVIHNLMMQAFMKYKDEVPPSSALEETVQSMFSAMEEGERALFCYIDDRPAGMVRFKITDSAIDFYRLSVIPENQGQGVAKELLGALEGYSKENGVSKIRCKVRRNASKNIKLYLKVGYKVYDEEIVNKPNNINLKVVSMEKEI